jgi:hypothetical protein
VDQTTTEEVIMKLKTRVKSGGLWDWLFPVKFGKDTDRAVA